MQSSCRVGTCTTAWDCGIDTTGGMQPIKTNQTRCGHGTAATEQVARACGGQSGMQAAARRRTCRGQLGGAHALHSKICAGVTFTANSGRRRSTAHSQCLVPHLHVHQAGQRAEQPPQHCSGKPSSDNEHPGVGPATARRHCVASNQQCVHDCQNSVSLCDSAHVFARLATDCLPSQWPHHEGCNGQ
jgi:hypothetical protein